jgi:hypothetical protein
MRLGKIGTDGEEPFADVMKINRPDDLDDIANLGLTVADGKRLLAARQSLLKKSIAGVISPSIRRVHQRHTPWHIRH